VMLREAGSSQSHTYFMSIIVTLPKSRIDTVKCREVPDAMWHQQAGRRMGDGQETIHGPLPGPPGHYVEEH